MAIFWVQQWIALPIIVEEPMGDTGDAGCFLQDQFRQEHFGDPTPSFSTGYPDPSQPSSGSKAGEVPQAGNPPFLSQYSSIPPAQQMPQDPRSGNQHGTRSFNYNLNHDPSLNMASMVEALPEYSTNSSHQGMQQRHSQVGQPALSGASTSALVYQLQQISQYPGQTGPAYPNQLGINTAYQASPYQNMYSQRSAGPSPTQQSYPPISPQNQQYFYYPNQYGQTTASPQFMGHPGQMNSPYDRSFGAAQVPTVGQQHSYMLQQQARVTPAGGIGSLGSQFGAAGSSGMYASNQMQFQSVKRNLCRTKPTNLRSKPSFSSTPGTTSKAKTIWARSLGRQSTSGNDSTGS